MFPEFGMSLVRTLPVSGGTALWLNAKMSFRPLGERLELFTKIVTVASLLTTSVG